MTKLWVISELIGEKKNAQANSNILPKYKKNFLFKQIYFSFIIIKTNGNSTAKRRMHPTAYQSFHQLIFKELS